MKIYSIKERVLCILAALLFGVISIVSFVNYNNQSILAYVFCAGIMFLVVALVKMFYIPYHIIIDNNRIEVFDFPLLATNKFYVQKRSLISWNNEIDIDEVEKIELIMLTKEEQIKHVGYRHLSNKYLKFNLRYGSCKYVYVGCYSSHQINIIKSTLNKD